MSDEHTGPTDPTPDECRREMLRYFDEYCSSSGRPATWTMQSEVFELLCGRSGAVSDTTAIPSAMTPEERT